jgi:transcriptional regulator with XRE-family HTH domain
MPTGGSTCTERCCCKLASLPQIYSSRLSHEAIAVDAEIDRTYVSRLERGLENPTVAVPEKLAKGMHAPIASVDANDPAFEAGLPGRHRSQE